MALVDIKPDNGWFTWVKNRKEGCLINERLDRFLTSMAVVENFPFIATKVVRQTQSDHDTIILDLWGRKLKDYPKDNRLYFKFDVCWVGDEEARNVIERAWNRKGTDYRDKIERIELVIDSASREESGKTLKETRRRLDFLYVREESYWAQRSRSRWLREGDRNIRYFHAKATGRLKKNNIEKLKYAEGNWVTNSKGISKVVKDYFVRLFRSKGQNANIQEMGYMKECVTRETNEWLNMIYTEKEPLVSMVYREISSSIIKRSWEMILLRGSV
ncbi:hypothetical protein V6Z12_D12G068000 [Gossypium hirsutum]